jgi:hypothetical protein
VKEINFRLENVSDNQLTASLVSLDGKLVHRQSIVTSNTSNLYSLDLKNKPLPGTYTLVIKGDNTSLNDRVVVQ